MNAPAAISLRADLHGSDGASGADIAAQSSTPVLELCRLLLAAGHSANTRLEVFRGNLLALRVRSIGEGADLEVSPKGTGFVKARPAVRKGPPIAADAQAVIHHPGPNRRAVAERRAGKNRERS